MNRVPAAAIVVAATIAAVPAAAQQRVLLRFTPPVGQVTHYRTVSQTWMQVPGMPAGDTTQPTMTQTMFSTRTVTAMDGDARVLTSVIDSSTQGMGPMSGMMPSGDLFRGMVTTQHVDPLGHVVSKEVTPPPGADPMLAQAMQRGGASSRSSLPMPSRPVRPGDTWSASDTMETGAAPGGAGGHVILDLTFKLERVERQGGARVATIAITGAMHGDSAGAVGAAEGKLTGEMVFDVGASRMTRSTTETTMEVHSPDGSVVPVRTVSTTDVLP